MEAPQEWRKIIMALPDKDFFPILRNYLGRIETPFHKPALIDQLFSFLSREETVERIVQSIDPEDALVLTSVAYLGDPGQKQLQKLLSGTFTYLELHHRLLNLEERLLIYRTRDGIVKLSPLFQEELERRVINPDLLFPSTPAKKRILPSPWPTEQLLCAMLHMQEKHGGSLTKADGEFRKRVQQDLQDIFSTLPLSHLRLFLRGMKLLGIDQGPGSPALKALSRMEKSSRSWLLMGAVSLAADGEEELRRGECRLRAERLRLFAVQLDPDRVYSEETLITVFSAALVRKNLEDPELDRYPSLLERCGALIREETGLRRADFSFPEAEQDGTTPLVLVQPDFSITINPGMDLRQATGLTAFLNLRRYDLYPSYELNRESFHRGCSWFPPESFRLLLQELATPIPQNITTSLTSWENEISSITLVSGIILQVGEERRHLVDHDPEVAPFLEKRLGPGIYLLDPAKEEQWRKSLEKAGVYPLPPVTSPGEKSSREEDAPSQWHPPELEDDLHTTDAAGVGTVVSSGKIPEAGREGEKIREELKRHLSGLTLSRNDRDELQARIEKKLILFPGQLLPGLGDQEKHEAKGLDYTGKVRLIERSLSEGNALLEVVERSRGGAPRRLLVKPEELKKNGTDLLLQGKALPEETAVTVMVRRISLIRKLKSSLFAPPVKDTRDR